MNAVRNDFTRNLEARERASHHAMIICVRCSAASKVRRCSSSVIATGKVGGVVDGGDGGGLSIQQVVHPICVHFFFSAVAVVARAAVCIAGCITLLCVKSV